MNLTIEQSYNSINLGLPLLEAIDWVPSEYYIDFLDPKGGLVDFERFSKLVSTTDFGILKLQAIAQISLEARTNDDLKSILTELQENNGKVSQNALNHLLDFLKSTKHWPKFETGELFGKDFVSYILFLSQANLNDLPSCTPDSFVTSVVVTTLNQYRQFVFLEFKGY